MVLAVPATAWADHGVAAPMDPVLAAILWGATGLLVVMIVVFIVRAFTRRASGPQE